MTAISSSGPPAPRRMMEPLPNCRSICAIANSSACRRSLFASAMRVSLFSDVVQCSVTLFSDVREHSMLLIILGVVRGCRQCPGIVTASEGWRPASGEPHGGELCVARAAGREIAPHERHTLDGEPPELASLPGQKRVGQRGIA